MDDRRRDSHAVPRDAATRDRCDEQVIKVPKPSQEQREYLERIERSTGQYDPNVVIGGPRPKT
jgi:hypothetical protein